MKSNHVKIKSIFGNVYRVMYDTVDMNFFKFYTEIWKCEEICDEINRATGDENYCDNYFDDIDCKIITIPTNYSDIQIIIDKLRENDGSRFFLTIDLDKDLKILGVSHL
jgi:hypothetical protein